MEGAIAVEAERLGHTDHKSALQEFLQSRGMAPGAYHVIAETGPDHEKTFRVEVRIGGRVTAIGSGDQKGSRTVRRDSGPDTIGSRGELRNEVTSETAQVVEAREAAAAQREETHPATVREYIESLLVTVILALFGTTFVVQAFKIPSQSMEPTLLVGDHLLVNKFIFGGRGHWYDRLLPYREIRRGDIIVFKFPFQDHPHYVKRVIGIPGDRIKIVDQQVYVNGKRISEPYIVRDPAAPYDPFGDNFPPRSRSISAGQHAAGMVGRNFSVRSRRRNCGSS